MSEQDCKIKLFDRNMRLRKTIDNPIIEEKDGVYMYSIPKTKCRFIQLVVTTNGKGIKCQN